MVFEDLVKLTADLPCFSTRFLAAGRNLPQVRLQLARWVKSGKIIKISKGLYTLVPLYRKVKPEPFCVSANLKSHSYVSLQSALSWYGIIPEFVPVITAITTSRPQMIETPLGSFAYRYINKKVFWGYRQVQLNDNQTAFIAQPEKALLDLVYLTPGGEKMEFLRELRLQNLEKFDKNVLREFAKKSQKPKFQRAVENIKSIIDEGEGIEL